MSDLVDIMRSESITLYPNDPYRHQAADTIEALQKRAEEAEIMALGWMYTQACGYLENGVDIRTVEVPELMEMYHESKT